MKNIGFIFLGIVLIAWIIAIIVGMIAAFPYGVIGIIAIIGLGFLLAKAIKDRIESDEDDYYSKNVDK
jgi:hypothetical protein